MPRYHIPLHKKAQRILTGSFSATHGKYLYPFTVLIAAAIFSGTILQASSVIAEMRDYRFCNILPEVEFRSRKDFLVFRQNRRSDYWCYRSVKDGFYDLSCSRVLETCHLGGHQHIGVDNCISHVRLAFDLISCSLCAAAISS